MCSVRMWTTAFVLIFTCAPTDEAVTTNGHKYTDTNFPDKAKAESSISTRNSVANVVSSTETIFERQLPTGARFRGSNTFPSKETSEDSQPYFQRKLAPTEGVPNFCYDTFDCQKYLKQSVCELTVTGKRCKCLPDYVIYDNECLKKVYLGDLCRTTLQCPLNSFCLSRKCTCRTGYSRKDDECEENSRYTTSNILLAIITGVMGLIAISCLFVIVVSLKRKLGNVRRLASPDGPTTISSIVDAAGPITADPIYERIDKPPSYEEAMSSSASTLTIDIQDIDSSPPSYSEVQGRSRGAIGTA